VVQHAEPVGAQRYRERFGRYFEDFNVGDTYEPGPAARSPRRKTPGSRC